MGFESSITGLSIKEDSRGEVISGTKFSLMTKKSKLLLSYLSKSLSQESTSDFSQ
jgi:hypothetical protein